MKKAILSVICLMTAVAGLSAQTVTDEASYQLNKARDLWYNSANAAGVAKGDMAPWRNLSAGYNLGKGDFTDSWNAKSQTGYGASGDMLTNLGGFKLLADATFSRDELEQCMYNTSMYDVRWDMPFYVAMNTRERFPMHRMRAAASLSAVSPLMLNDRFSIALSGSFDYSKAWRLGSVTSDYAAPGFEVSPSVIVVIDDNNTLGIAARYTKETGTNVVSTGDGTSIEVVFLQGLGYYMPRWAGGNLGMAPILYSTDSKGASIQYNHKADAKEWLAEVSLDTGSTQVAESDGGRAKGAVNRYVTKADIQGIFGENRSRKLDLNVTYNLFYQLNGASGTAQGQGSLIDGGLKYTAYTGTGAGNCFNFMMGAGIDISSMDLSRVTNTSFKALSLLPYAFVGKNFRFAEAHSLLATLNAGYNFAMNTKYTPPASLAAGDVIANFMYDDEADYLHAYYARITAEVTYTFRIGNVLSLYARPRGGYIKPMNADGARAMCDFALGVIF